MIPQRAVSMSSSCSESKVEPLCRVANDSANCRLSSCVPQRYISTTVSIRHSAASRDLFWLAKYASRIAGRKFWSCGSSSAEASKA